jgi:polyhydroxyalkanoate synthesis regulator phasin
MENNFKQNYKRRNFAMPSGYTSPIYEGKNISAKEYILRCARAFGATIMMRDEPLDAEIPVFEPDTYHLEQVEELKKELQKYKEMTLEEAQKILDEEYGATVKRIKTTIEKKNELKQRYMKILNEVKTWTPPTSEHIRLKEFAIEQLEQSIDWDCDTSYLQIPEKETPEEWLKRKISKIEWDIAYHTKKWVEEVQRTKERNEWIKQLKDSLESL